MEFGPTLKLRGRRNSTISQDGSVICWTELGRGFPLVICSPAAIPYSYWMSMLELIEQEFRCIFLHPRGIWEGWLPDNIHAVTVDHHARDLAAVVRACSLDLYGIVGHCAGVTTTVAAFKYLTQRPKRVALCSTRFGRGTPIDGLDRVADRVLTDARFRRQYTQVVSAYAPAALRNRLEVELACPKKLASHLFYVQSTREYLFEELWPDDVSAVLAWARDDFDVLRESTKRYAHKLGKRCVWSTELEGGHCVLQEDKIIGSRLLREVFNEFI
jgi:pimeloyl-ACP methyl ester carboxylesterase